MNREEMKKICLDLIEKNKKNGYNYNNHIDWKSAPRLLTKEDMQKSHDENMRLIDKYEYLVIKKLKEQSSNRNTH